MKKAILLMGMMLLSLTSCDKKEEKELTLEDYNFIEPVNRVGIYRYFEKEEKSIVEYPFYFHFYIKETIEEKGKPIKDIKKNKCFLYIYDEEEENNIYIKGFEEEELSEYFIYESKEKNYIYRTIIDYRIPVEFFTKEEGTFYIKLGMSDVEMTYEKYLSSNLKEGMVSKSFSYTRVKEDQVKIVFNDGVNS